MVDPALLRNATFRAAVGGNMVCSFALIGNAVFMTAYLQLVLGHSPLSAALWSLAPTLGVAVAAPFAAPLGRRLGRSRAAAAGMAAAALGFVLLTTVGTDALVPTLVGAGALATGLVVTMTICAELVLAALRPEQAGAGAAVSEAATELGAVYRAYAGDHLAAGDAHGPAGQSLAGAAALAGRLTGHAADHLLGVARDAFVHGLHLAAAAGAVLLLVAAVASWMGARTTD
jgi:DHA2 family multidrug resistance protein-like MFS transporter